MSAVAVRHALSRARFDLSSEKAVQAGIESVLVEAFGHAAVEREIRLSPRDRIDLLLFGRVGLEVKVKGARKMGVWKQLNRYAEHDRIAELLLVTGLSMGLPAEIGGKPVYYLSLGRAWI